MAKILFVNPVVREEDVPRHIPYGIALLASVAMNNEHQVQIYDANAWRKGFDVLREVYQADQWDVIAIGGLTTTYGFIKTACKIAREECPNTFLLAGGGFLSSMPLEMMRFIPEIDLGVIGEAFVTFPEVLEKLDNGDCNWVETLGVVYRNAQLEPVLTDVRPNIENLDAIPWPAWDLLPLDIYFRNSSALFSEELFLAKRRIDINASYGCNLVCRYCWHLGTAGDMVVRTMEDGKKDVVFSYGRTIRYHSVDYIIAMVKDLKQKYDVDFVSFLDENLMTIDRYSKGVWLQELCEKWIESGLQPHGRKDLSGKDKSAGSGVYWSGTSHAALHRPEILKLMYRAGCTHLVYGLESFDQIILKDLGKGSTVQKNKESIGICMSSGIIPIPNIIIGFPGETFDSIRNTIHALLELGIHARPHFATAYPGSEWYYTYKDSILMQYNGDLETYLLDLGDATKITAVISHKFSGIELVGLQDVVANRDLRLLDLAEKHWGDSDKTIRSLAVPQKSSNFVRKKIKAPKQKLARRI